MENRSNVVDTPEEEIDNTSKTTNNKNKELKHSKPHFIIKEYFGKPKPKKTMKSLYIEKKIIHTHQDDTLPPQITHTPIIKKIALVGGIIASSAIGLYFLSKHEEE